MIIRVADLEPGGLHVETALSPGPLMSDAGEEIPIEGARFRGDVRRSCRGIEVRGRLTCRAQLSCARCLAVFRIEVDRELLLRYAFSAPSGRDIEIPEEDLDVDFLDEDGELDLTALASEQVYLEIPMKPVCRSSCRGLCTVCGSDLNRGACRCADRPAHA